MIISHKYKFIFIKTQKTGGTSLEIALSKFCGPDDVITPFGRDHKIFEVDEKLRQHSGFRGPQNFRVPILKLSAKDMARTIYRQKRPPMFTEHEPAEDIRKKIDQNTFKAYRKFAVLRNPFDAAVSSYFWHINVLGARDSSLFEFLTRNPASINKNWMLCCDRDRNLLLDQTLRYENLENDLASLSEHLGFPGNIYDEMRSIRAKATVRPSQTKNYRDFIDERSRVLIEILCYNEIQHFGYEF